MNHSRNHSYKKYIAFAALLAFFATPWRLAFGQAASVPSVGLSWDVSPTPGVTSQVLYRGTSATGPWTAIATFANNTTSTFTDSAATDSSFVAGTTYFYEIDALVNGASSGPSDVASAASLVNPAPPTGLVAVGQ